MFENNESMNTVHWFDAFSSATPMNNPITLISPVESLGYIFVAAGSLCVTLQISEQFSPKARTPTHWMSSSNQILTQNDHSRSFNVIRFGVNEEPPRGYIQGGPKKSEATLHFREYPAIHFPKYLANYKR